MATVKKSKKKVIVPICIVLVIAIIAGVIFGVSKANSGVSVSLYTIDTDDIYETVSLTGEVSAGTSKEYKISTAATVKEVFVKVGDNVKKGDVLATFDITALNQQINSLQQSYNSSLNAYNSAVKAQKEAKEKVDILNKKIAEAEKALNNLENVPATTAATAKKTTKRPGTTAPITAPAAEPTTAPIIVPTTAPTEPSSSKDEDSSSKPSITIPSSPSISGDLTNTLEELNQTLTDVAENMEQLSEMTTVIAENLALIGQLDEQKIAQNIIDGLVESGVAEDAAKNIVESIDFEAVGKAFANSDNVMLATAQIQLVSLEAQRAIYNAQADTTTLSMQKTATNATKIALDALKSQQKEMEEGWIAAFDGTITAVDIEAGVQTTALSSGIKLENLDSMAVTVSLGEYDLHKVKVGMPVKVTSAYGSYDGEVTSIAPTATGGSSASILDNVGSMAGISGLSSLTDSGAGVECVVTISKTDENIIAGFDADVEIETGEYLGVVVVPIESIKLEKTGSYVYLYNEDEKTVTKTQIETGAVSDSAYEVKSGLKVGDKIVAAPETTYEEDTFKVKVVTK